MPRKKAVKSESDTEVIEGGGFMIEKKKRKPRVKKLPEVLESSGDELMAIKPRKRKIAGAKLGPTSKARKYKVEVSDSETLDDQDEDYVPEDAEDSADDEVVEVVAADVAAEIESSSGEDVPLAEVARPKRKAPKKPTKPRKKPDYFLNMTNRLFNNHEELKGTFSGLHTMEKIPVVEAPHPEGMTINLLPFQLEGLDWLVRQEDSKFGGGILADEMGMGKTIQTIGLFMHDTKKTPNLVVAPAVAIVQWKSEIEAHTNNKLKVYIFHGANRTTNVEELMEYDVILTTYAILESVWRKQERGFKRVNGSHKEKSCLHAIEFYRVILDEAHCIKDRQSGTAKSVNNLKCVKRWCLSGTPLQNRIGEMYSLIRFLRIQPFCNYYCTKCDCASMEWNFIGNRECAKCGCRPMQHTSYFNHFFLKSIIKYGITDEEGNLKDEKLAASIEENGYDVNQAVKMTSDMSKRGAEAFNRLQLLLSRIMLRRTKVERSDDLGLPPKVVEVRYDLFNPEEKDLYQSLYSDSSRQFNDYIEEGVVLNNYANIFTLITRMRQLADHPDLVLKKMNNRAIAGYDTIVCQLCDDEAEDAIESKCHHRFCRLCIQEYIESFDSVDSDKALDCPVCHIGLTIDLNAPGLEVQETLETKQKTSIVNKINMSSGKWKSSTKIEALVEELYKLRSGSKTVKSIVYSQFTSFLDLIDWRLKRAGFKTVRLQGSMSPQQRANTISHFMNNVHVEVFLVSLKAGGVALNLTEASQIFIMDPWWNPAVEWQCDRVHRILQMRPVRIVKFCIADSIEKKILELQDKKADMVNATVGGDQSAANRLTPADLQFLFTS